jgi:hypothetical protein
MQINVDPRVGRDVVINTWRHLILPESARTQPSIRVANNTTGRGPAINSAHERLQHLGNRPQPGPIRTVGGMPQVVVNPVDQRLTSHDLNLGRGQRSGA